MPDLSDVEETDEDEVLWAEEAVLLDPLGRRMSPERLSALAAGRAKRVEHLAKIKEARDAGAITRYRQYKAGALKVEEMDDEEIQRGRFRDLAGGWSGNNSQQFSGPDMLTMRRELLRRGQRMLEQNYHQALKALTEIAVNPSPMVKEGDRLKAINMIMERVAGKVPDKVEVGGADAFADLLKDVVDDGVIRDMPDVVQGVVVGEER